MPKPYVPPTTTTTLDFVGCFFDNTNDINSRVMVLLHGGGATTITCQATALLNGYKYFAMQFLVVCFGSNDFIKATSLGLLSNDPSACGGGSGGSFVNALYQTTFGK